MWIFRSILVFITFYFSNSLIPNQCAVNFTYYGSNVCCPIPIGFKNACGFPYRGECRFLQTKPHSIFTPFNDIKEDIRYEWPVKLFQYFCHCYSSFSGADCGHCSFGFIGKNCLERKILIRKNVMNLNKTELDIFRAVVNLSRYEASSFMVLTESYSQEIGLPKLVPATVYEALVFIHQFAARPFLDSNVLCENRKTLSEFTDHNHNGPGFLTWHRYFMLEWERMSSEIARKHFNINEFTFPYWDWTDKTQCDVCIDKIIGAAGQSLGRTNFLSRRSTFYNWTEICPNDVQNPCRPCDIQNFKIKRITRSWTENKFPTKMEINHVLSLEDYYETVYMGSHILIDKKYVSVHKFRKPCNSFESALEGSCLFKNKYTMHNKVHNIVYGTFFFTQSSVNDPLFILHHIQIDRVFELWLRNHKDDLSFKFPKSVLQHGHCYFCFMVGFLPPVKHKDMFKISWNLGYDYDTFNFG